jgi:hypothetical protein
MPPEQQETPVLSSFYEHPYKTPTPELDSLHHMAAWNLIYFNVKVAVCQVISGRHPEV